MEKGIKEYWVVSIGWLLMVEINEDREFLKWNHFCRNLGHRPEREDYNRFLKIIK